MRDRLRHTLKKHPKPVFWIGFSLAIVGIVLYLAQDPATIRVESPVAAADPRFPDYVASLVGAPVHVGDAYTVLHNGDETYPAMLAAIDNAKTRMNFETYVFNDGDIADRFVDALARAAQRGVFVRIVLDPVGSSLNSKSTDKLKAAGAKVAWFNPLGFFSLEDSTTAPIARRSLSTATSRSPAASASPTSGSATRKTRNTGGTAISASSVPRCAPSKDRSTRTGSKPAGCRRRRSIRKCRRARPARVQLWCGAIP